MKEDPKVIRALIGVMVSGQPSQPRKSADLKFATYRLMARDEALEGFCIASHSSADYGTMQSNYLGLPEILQFSTV